MEWVKLILSFAKELFIPTVAYIAGKKSKELEQVKKENKKLKEYKEIDELEITKDELANMELWK